jgi:hypothetical protein
MKARFLTLAAVAAMAAACGGGGEQEAGDSVEPGATGTIESTGPQTTPGAAAPADTMTATSGSTAGGATDAPNAPPPMTGPATEGDTTKQ